MTAIAMPPLKRPLVAILRGLRPDEADAIACVLGEAGFEAIEIPLNSPDPFRSIEIARKALPDTPLVGAGTVLDPADVARLADAGGNLVVSPNVDAGVIAAAGEAGMVSLPGVFSPTEALAALGAGASGLKFFPASVLEPSGIAAIRTVLPPDTFLAAVGGVSEADFAAYAQAGIDAFGLGSSLYKPGLDAAAVGARAGRIIEAWDRIHER